MVPIAACSSEPDLCPARALKTWMASVAVKSGPIFLGQWPDGRFRETHVDAQHLNRLVKRCLAALGIDARPFGAHSLRAGFVTEGFRRGESIAAISAVTRHRDPKVLMGYRREVDPFVGSAAQAVAAPAPVKPGTRPGTPATSTTPAAAPAPSPKTIPIAAFFLPSPALAAIEAEVRAGRIVVQAVALPAPVHALKAMPGADDVTRYLHARAAAWMVAAGYEVGLADELLVSMDGRLITLVGPAGADHVLEEVGGGRTVLMALQLERGDAVGLVAATAAS